MSFICAQPEAANDKDNKLRRVYDAIETIAFDELGLDIYNMRPKLAQLGLTYVDSPPSGAVRP